MSRRMSCALTIDAVRDRRKTVTRRHVDTWRTLKPGDRLTLVEKAMGLRKGERHVVLAEVVVVSVRVETLGEVDAAEIEREGFDADEWTPSHAGWEGHRWAHWWAESHGYRGERYNDMEEVAAVPCRRIEWRYLDNEVLS